MSTAVRAHGGSAMMGHALGSSPTLVRARGVVRRYSGGRSVGPIDLEVAEAQVLAIMGPNGAGKSTLLRLLASADRPDAGGVEWWGVSSRLLARRGIGYSPDEPVEEVSLSVRQSTHFWCRQWIDDPNLSRTMVDEILDELDLADRSRERVGSLSWGLRRRLGIAQALVHQPRLALLDEPSAGLDPVGVTLVTALLRRRAAAGKTTVVASNDPDLVTAVADQVALLDAGRCRRLASLAALLEEIPARRRVELRLGSAAIASSLAGVPGARLVSLVDDRAVVEIEDDAALARLVIAADAGGEGLRSLEVRRPDLRDCFHALVEAGRP
jgi:ABC-type multidrug transport system ATPase subunit